MIDKDYGLTYMDEGKYSNVGKGFIWVRIGYTKINGKNKPWFQKTFKYSKYKSKTITIREARKWRDRKHKEFSIIAKRLNLDYQLPFKTKSVNHTTGITGVYISQYWHKQRNYMCIEANATITINGKRYEISRSVNKYGEDEAVRLCHEWRKEMEIKFNPNNRKTRRIIR